MFNTVSRTSKSAVLQRHPKISDSLEPRFFLTKFTISTSVPLFQNILWRFCSGFWGLLYNPNNNFKSPLLATIRLPALTLGMLIFPKGVISSRWEVPKLTLLHEEHTTPITNNACPGQPLKHSNVASLSRCC